MAMMGRKSYRANDPPGGCCHGNDKVSVRGTMTPPPPPKLDFVINFVINHKARFRDMVTLLGVTVVIALLAVTNTMMPV